MSFIWDGVSSDTMKFNVTSRQVYNAPAYDLNAIEVPGRSGDLLNPQNRFKNKQISYTGFLKASDFEGTTWREKLSTGLIQLKGWLCSDAGTYHELTDDYDPGFTRYGYISGETAISDVQDRPFGVTLTVTFNCKPFMYKAGEPMELPETKSASGSIITITDGAENTPLKSCVVNIEPVQDLHGYDYPWPAGGGKNLLDSSTLLAGYYDNKDSTALAATTGVFKTVELQLDAGTYTVSFGVNVNIVRYREFKIVSKTNVATDITQYTFTLTTSALVAIGFRRNDNTAWQTDTEIQLELGSTPTSFVPYSNICPISGRTQVDAVAAGANLMKQAGTGRTNSGVTYVINSDGTITLTNTATGSSYLSSNLSYTESTKQFFTYFPAGTYAVSGGVSSAIRLYFVGVKASTLSGTSSFGVDTGSGATFTLSEPYYLYTQILVSNGTATNLTIKPMVVKGSTPKTWAAPTITPIHIPLGQTVYGGTLDVVRGKLNAKPYYASYSGQTLVGPWISSHDKYVAGATPTTGAQVVDMGAEGTDYDVTPQTIKTLKGTNNLWSDAGEMTIEYPIPTENPYPFGSRPLYEITMAGTGTLVVNSGEWTITDYTGTLYCDTEAMEWYDVSQLRNNIVSGDGWPVFEAGENSVSYTGDITKVMVTPRWRTL